MGTLVSICKSDDNVRVVKQQESNPTAKAPSTLTSASVPLIEDAAQMELDINTIPSKEPMTFFQKWFEQAQYSDGIRLATSMTLATATKDGKPSCRIVGVKGFDKTGFKIATNGKSKKAQELMENPQASLMFYWEPLNRMVRVDGAVSRLPEENAIEIWKGFPKSAQMTHGASNQGEVITSRQVLLDRKHQLAIKYPDQAEVPKHPDWCAFNLVPDQWEFFQISEDLPDRLVFRRPKPGEVADEISVHTAHEGWLMERISP